MSKPFEALSPTFDPGSIKYVPLNLKNNTRYQGSSRWPQWTKWSQNKLAFLLENFLTPEECQKLIDLSEAEGYQIAAINTRGGEIIDTSYRKSGRVILDDPEFANVIWERLKGYIPEDFGIERDDRVALGMNERLRFLKYKPGDMFKKHYDGCYERPDGSARTMITLQLYLNGDCKGGETTFFEGAKGPTRIKPETGLALIFEHKILHEGSTLLEGVKYTIRMDILFERAKGKPPTMAMQALSFLGLKNRTFQNNCKIIDV